MTTMGFFARAPAVNQVEMSEVRKRPLLYKLLLLMLPLLVLSITITGVVLSWTSHSYSLKTINQDYSNIVKSSAGEIRLYMENAEKGLSGLSMMVSVIRLDRWQQELALSAFIHKMPEFISISLISTEGKELGTTGREGEIEMVLRSETFLRACGGKNAISDLLRTEESIPYVHIAIPVLSLGKVTRVIWGELNLKSVWDVLKGIHVGRTGQVFIIDRTGRFIGHREMDRVVRGLSAVDSEILRRIHESDTSVQWIDESERPKSYRLGYRIPGLDWTIVLSQSYQEIYGYLYKNIIWAIAITLIISVIAIFLGWDQIRRFLKPIQSLHRQVQEVGKGNLDQKITVDPQDEIGDLGLAFNEMTGSLKRLIHREVEQAKELVRHKNLAVLGTTASKVTHEVGNLLNNVGLTLTALKEEGLSESGKRAVGIIENDSERVRGFIHNYLQFAKAPDLNLEKVSLDKIVREVYSIQKPAADKKAIRLDLDWTHGLPPVMTDSRFIYQVFTNLVKNSLEAMEGPGQIRIDGEIDGEYLRIGIKDTGTGIPADVVEGIFDPFFTTKGKKGTGLGLSIVKTIVETHRGTIECRSEMTQGTTFTIRLPLRDY